MDSSQQEPVSHERVKFYNQMLDNDNALNRNSVFNFGLFSFNIMNRENVIFLVPPFRHCQVRSTANSVTEERCYYIQNQQPKDLPQSH